MSGNLLTTKQRLFVEAYLANPNATESARLAGYSGDGNALSQRGHELVRNSKISALLEKKIETFAMTAMEVLNGVRTIALDESERASDRLKAYELIGKHLELWTEKQKIDGKLKIEIEYV